jgi:hypothetical protein
MGIIANTSTTAKPTTVIAAKMNSVVLGANTNPGAAERMFNTATTMVSHRPHLFREHFKTLCYGVRAASRKEEISGWCMAHFVLRARPPRPFD